MRSILPHVRALGYGEDDEEQEDGLMCLAVPVFDPTGQVAAALSISFPTMRCGAGTKAQYVAPLQQASAAITARHGPDRVPISACRPAPRRPNAESPPPDIRACPASTA